MAGLNNSGGGVSGAVRAGRAWVELFANDNKVYRALAKLETRFKKFGNFTAGIGAKLFGAGVGLAAPLAGATAIFADFDDAIRLAGSVAGATAAEMASMTEVAKELGRTTSFTAADVAKLMGELGRAGFKPKEIEEMTGAVLNLARATGTEAPLAAEIMASTLRQFALDAKDGARVADVLAMAANKSNASVEGLGESLKYAGPVAADLGLAVEDTVALLGVLANVGIKGSEAGTSLRRLGLTAATEGAKLKALGVQTTDTAGNLRPLVDIMDDLFRATESMPNAERAKVLNDVFGVLSVTSASALSKNSTSVRELADALRNSRGEAEKTAKQMDAGVGGAWRMFKSAVEGSAIAVGETLAPVLVGLSTIINEGVAAVTAFVKNNRELTTAIAAAAVVLIAGGAALTALGLAATVAGTALGGLVLIAKGVAAVVGVLLNPITLLIAGIGALGYILLTQTEAGRGFVAWIKGGILPAIDTLVQAWGGITAALSKGDFALAGKIALKGLEVVWLDFVHTLELVWMGFKMTFVDAWHEIVRDVKVLWTAFSAWLVRNIADPIEKVLSLASSAAIGAGQTDLANKIESARGKVLMAKAGASAEAANDEIRGILDDAKAAADQRMLDRIAAVKAAEMAVADAKAELTALVDAAKKQPEDVVGGAGLALLAGNLKGGGIPAAAAKAMEIAGSRGTFSALQATQLGFDAIPKQQLDELKDINAGVNATVKAVEGVAKGLRFK